MRFPHAINRDQVKQHIDYFFQVIDPSLRQQYEHYLHRSTQPVFLVSGLCLIFTFYVLPSIIYHSVVEYGHKDQNTAGQWVLTTLYVMSVLMVIGFGRYLLASLRASANNTTPSSVRMQAIMTMGREEEAKDNAQDHPPSSANAHEKLVSYIFVCSLEVSLLLNFVHNMVPSYQGSQYLLEQQAMGDAEASKNLIFHDVLLLSIFPLLSFHHFLELNVVFVLAINTLSSIAILCAAIFTAHWTTIPYVVLWMIASFMILIEAHLTQLAFFLSCMSFDSILNSRERSAEEKTVLETRHMIANVAHDLKTPLSSFMSGLDFIDQSLSEFEKQYLTTLKSANPKDRMFEWEQLLSSLRYCSSSIRNTNNFMLMTINRCLDSTKAMSNLKLVAKPDTVDLLETLELPLTCMQNIQDKIEIELLPIPEFICSHVITDKQWLQENLLCLLSNSVKYSNTGRITVTVSMETVSIERVVSIEQRTDTTHLTSSNNKASISGVLLSFLNLSDGHSDASSNCSGNITGSSPNTARSAVEDVDFLRFEVEDTGIGMSDEAMNSLFSPFQQNQRLAGGTGLGLFSLGKRLDALGGRYGAMKRRDGQQGSLFWFAFPYKPDEISASLFRRPLLSSKSQSASGIFTGLHINILNSKSTSFSLPSSPKSSGAMSPQLRAQYDSKVNNLVTNQFKESPNDRLLNILIGEDSSAIMKMTRMMLQRLNHKVVEANNGATALQMVENYWKESNAVYDVILMDLQMPVMDGLEAIRRIRQLESSPTSLTAETSEHILPHTYIIAMSANSDEITQAEAYAAGADMFMAKPFKIDTFQSIIKMKSFSYSV